MLIHITMHVYVVPYNPKWPQQFLAIKASLEDIFKSYNVSNMGKSLIRYTAIEHVGSTSIPSMPAKPRIDIDIMISNAADLPPLVEALTGCGQYEYKGDLGIPERWAFEYLLPTLDDGAEDTTGSEPPRNLYVTIAGCLHLRNHIATRDLCRSNDQVRRKYAEVKIQLSQREWRTVDEYCEAKSEVIAWMLGQAGLSDEEVSRIRGNNTSASETTSS